MQPARHKDIDTYHQLQNNINVYFNLNQLNITTHIINLHNSIHHTKNSYKLTTSN